MKIKKGKKFIAIALLTAVMAFGAVTAVSASTNVLATMPSVVTTTEAPFDFEGLRRAGDEMRATFPYRFPDVPVSRFNDVNFNGSWDTIGGNLEINLQNANLRIIFRNDEIMESNRRNSSPNDYRRVFAESSDWSTAYSLRRLRSGGSVERGVFVWDSNESRGAVITLFIPYGAGQVFGNVNIHLENGNLEIDEDVKEFLAENLNISVVNGDINGYEIQAPVSLTDAIRIARNHIGLPLESGGGFSARMIEIDGRQIFHFWINGCEVLTNLSIDAIASFYEFRICIQSGEILEFIEESYPPNARR